MAYINKQRNQALRDRVNALKTDNGVAFNFIAKMSNVDTARLSKFVNGHIDFSDKNLDKLDYFFDGFGVCYAENI